VYAFLPLRSVVATSESLDFCLLLLLLLLFVFFFFFEWLEAPPPASSSYLALPQARSKITPTCGDVEELLGGPWEFATQLVDQGLTCGPRLEGPNHVGVGDIGQLIALLGEKNECTHGEFHLASTDSS
jgi:hypothetical protein